MSTIPAVAIMLPDILVAPAAALLPALPCPVPVRRSKRAAYSSLACDLCRARKRRCDRDTQRKLKGDDAAACSLCTSANRPCGSSGSRPQQRLKSSQPHQQQPIIASAVSTSSQTASITQPALQPAASTCGDGCGAEANGAAQAPSRDPFFLSCLALDDSSDFSVSPSFWSASRSRGSSASPLPPAACQSPLNLVSGEELDALSCGDWTADAEATPTSCLPQQEQQLLIPSRSLQQQQQQQPDSLSPPSPSSPFLSFPQPDALCSSSSSSSSSSPIRPLAADELTSSSGHDSRAVAVVETLSASVLPLLPRSAQRLAEYVSSYFSLLNRGLYFFIDEAAFWPEWEAEQQQQQQQKSLGTGADAAWLLCTGAVLALGARMSGDPAFAERAAARAREAALSFLHPSNKSRCSCQAVWRSHLALAYRSCLALQLYAAAMAECCSELVRIASHLLSLDGVEACVPPAVQRLGAFMPVLAAVFPCMARPNASWPLSGSHQQLAEISSVPSCGDAAAVAAFLRSQSEAYPLDRWKYLKVKRLLQSKLRLAPDDRELMLGRELDASLDTRVELCSTTMRAELAAINVFMTETALRWEPAQPLPFSVYNALSLLLKAEAAALPLHQRCGVLGRKAACYLLLGETELAVDAARACVSLLVSLRSLSASFCLPPFALSFTRCVGLLGEFDCSEGSGDLIAGGLRVVQEIARLWPAVERALHSLLQQLQLWTQQQVERAEAALQLSRRRLEAQVLAARGRGGGLDSAQLAAIAAHFVQRSQRLRHLLHKRLSVQQQAGMTLPAAADEVSCNASLPLPRSVDGTSAAAAAAAADCRSPLASALSVDADGFVWSIESVTALFSRSLDLRSDPLQLNAISRPVTTTDSHCNAVRLS